jgi:hypothetical protein
MSTIKLIPNDSISEQDFTTVHAASVESLYNCTRSDQFLLFCYRQDEHDPSIIAAREHFFRPNDAATLSAIYTLAKLMSEHTSQDSKLQHFANALIDNCENLGLISVLHDN